MPEALPIHLRWVLVPLFCTLTGYTEKAVRRKIEEGIWLQGRHWRKAPDGRITMDLQAYYDWVEGQDRTIESIARMRAKA